MNSKAAIAQQQQQPFNQKWNQNKKHKEESKSVIHLHSFTFKVHFPGNELIVLASPWMHQVIWKGGIELETFFNWVLLG